MTASSLPSRKHPFHGVLRSCPFCEGPPVPFVRFTDDAGKVVRDAHIAESEDGLHAHAQVFCHECGAEGPVVDELAYTSADVEALKQRAIDGWNNRDSRHRDLFDASVAAGLCTEQSVPSETASIPLNLQPHAELIALAEKLSKETPAHWTSGEKRALLGFLNLHVGYHTVHAHRHTKEAGC
jgi:hypothetical protein